MVAYRVVIEKWTLGIHSYMWNERAARLAILVEDVAGEGLVSRDFGGVAVPGANVDGDVRTIGGEKLAGKLAEVFEQNRKATEAIAALRPNNPVAEALVADAAGAQTGGDREEARWHLRAARETAEAAAADAGRLARQAEMAAGPQMLQTARTTSAEAELAPAGLDYEEAARPFREAAALVPAANWTSRMR